MGIFGCQQAQAPTVKIYPVEVVVIRVAARFPPAGHEIDASLGLIYPKYAFYHIFSAGDGVDQGARFPVVQIKVMPSGFLRAEQDLIPPHRLQDQAGVFHGSVAGFRNYGFHPARNCIHPDQVGLFIAPVGKDAKKALGVFGPLQRESIKMGHRRDIDEDLLPTCEVEDHGAVPYQGRVAGRAPVIAQKAGTEEGIDREVEQVHFLSH